MPAALQMKRGKQFQTELLGLEKWQSNQCSLGLGNGGNPSPVVQSSLRGHKDVKKDGDGAAGERPAKRART